MRILRVSNASEHTSAPLNSFTLARNRFYDDEEITYLSFFKNKEEAVDLYFQKYKSIGFSNRERLNFLEAQGNVKRFWKLVSEWINESQRSHEQSIIHMHQPRSGFIAALAARIKNRNIPILYTIHNNFKNYAFKHKVALFLNFILVNKITFVSIDAYNSFSLFRFFFNRKSIAVQNGVDVERIESTIKNFNPSKAKDSNEMKFISTGRFTPQKNQHFLIDVFENYEGNWHLDIYGNGQFEDSLRNKIKEKGLINKISLKNTVPRDEILKAYASADVYISTALWEGLPVAVMEAMTVGIPCIVSNIPSHQELGEDLPGVSITDFQIEHWHEKLDYWKSLGAEKRKAMGLHNKSIINNNFTLKIMQQNYRNLYEKLIFKEESI